MVSISKRAEALGMEMEMLWHTRKYARGAYIMSQGGEDRFRIQRNSYTGLWYIVQLPGCVGAPFWAEGLPTKRAAERLVEDKA